MHGPTCIFWANLRPCSLQFEKAAGAGGTHLEYEGFAALCAAVFGAFGGAELFGSAAATAEFYERAARFGRADGVVSFAELAAVLEVELAHSPELAAWVAEQAAPEVDPLFVPDLGPRFRAARCRPFRAAQQS